MDVEFNNSSNISPLGNTLLKLHLAKLTVGPLLLFGRFGLFILTGLKLHSNNGSFALGAAVFAVKCRSRANGAGLF